MLFAVSGRRWEHLRINSDGTLSGPSFYDGGGLNTGLQCWTFCEDD